MFGINWLGINKGDIKAILKSCAKSQRMSLSEFRAFLQETIDEEMYSDDPEVQENFKKHFGNKRPTPEEYI
ncbi:hypothetical protein IGJ28_002014 [Enterococcus sp. AZ091]|uniref:hypothetical protein n=1 Tax=Enterococcus sp. AZ091 TaxID=2774720 RepID=UPI003F1E5127